MGRKTCWSTAILAATMLACGSDLGDSGTEVFTTWGEEYIEQQVPADPSGESGFVDGWTVKYDKFLVVFHDIRLADRKGKIAARLVGSRFVDNVKPGRKTLATFDEVPARAWDAVGYTIAPAAVDSELVAGDAGDRDMMITNGYSLYVQGTARKGGVTKTFRWGFRTITQYTNCQQAAESGQAIAGVVITNGGTDTSELTTHGDHFFYDRLQTSADPAVTTKLRFDAIAAADRPGEGFGEITLEELDAAPLPLDPLYDPSGLPATTLGQFVTSLSRTVGHFRGEGECSFTAIR